MKLVMTLLVRDEEDILDSHLRYHLAQGVDHVIATDNLSEDRTPEILASYEEKGLLTWRREEGDNYAQGKWVSRMARRAYLDGADWVIHSDADEFWWPREGNLKSTLASLPADIGLLRVARTDFVPMPDDGKPFIERMVVRKQQSLNSLGATLPPKVCHRAHPQIEVLQGNHGVIGVELAALQGPCPMLILHFPLRTYKQFENKIVKGGRAYRRNTQLPENVGRTWRHLYALHQAGHLRDYYAQHEHSRKEVDRGLHSGKLVHDDRLLRFLSSLERPPASPSPRPKRHSRPGPAPRSR